jgi:hypothetical protein
MSSFSNTFIVASPVFRPENYFPRDQLPFVLKENKRIRSERVEKNRQPPRIDVLFSQQKEEES